MDPVAFFGQENYGDMLRAVLGTQPAADFKTVNIWQPDIQHDQVGQEIVR